jgi:hypothetical protein
MDLTENINSYEKLIAEVEQATKAIDWRPPHIDISEEIKQHAKNLRFVPIEERRARLIAYLRPQVSQALIGWRNTVGGGSGILTRIHGAMVDIENDLHRAEEATSLAHHRIAEAEEQRKERVAARERLRREEAAIKPVTRYSIWSYRIMIIGALLTAVLTAYFYLDMQVTLHAASQNIAIGSGEGAFKNNIDYLKSNPLDLIWGLGVIIFVMVGKIVSQLHASLKHPAWFFRGVAISAIALTVATGVLMAQVATTQSEVGLINGQISSIQAPDRDNPFAQPLDCGIDPQNARCVQVRGLENQLPPLKDQLRAYTFWMRLAIIMAEILLGSVAWMLASEHHEKHGIQEGMLQRRQQGIADEIRMIDEAIAENKKLIADAQQARVTGQVLANKFNALQSGIPGEARVQETCNAKLTEQIQRAEMILAELVHQWKIEDAVPPTA